MEKKQEQEQLTPEQQEIENNRLLALQAEKDAAAIVVDFTSDQIEAMKVTDCYTDRDELTVNAIASVIRGKVQAEIDRKSKAHSLAVRHGRDKVAAELIAQIIPLENLKARLIVK